MIRKFLKTNFAFEPLINLSIKTAPNSIPYIDLTETMTSNAKVNMFKLLWGTIKLALLGEHQKRTLIKFYRAIAVTMLLYGSKC